MFSLIGAASYLAVKKKKRTEGFSRGVKRFRFSSQRLGKQSFLKRCRGLKLTVRLMSIQVLPTISMGSLKKKNRLMAGVMIRLNKLLQCVRVAGFIYLFVWFLIWQMLSEL